MSNRSSYSTTSPLIGGAISALSRSFKKSTNESSCSFGQHSGRIYCAHGPRQSAARINIRPSRRKLEVPYSQVGHRTLMHIIFNVSYHPILTFPAVVVKMLAKNHARKIERGFACVKVLLQLQQATEQQLPHQQTQGQQSEQRCSEQVSAQWHKLPFGNAFSPIFSSKLIHNIAHLCAFPYSYIVSLGRSI